MGSSFRRWGSGVFSDRLRQASTKDIENVIPSALFGILTPSESVRK